MQISNYDVVLIDGDHNWYTVYHELLLIEKQAKKHKHLPVIFLHDVDWPYARRDLYYNPDTVPEVHRKPYVKKGLIPETSSPVERGGDECFFL